MEEDKLILVVDDNEGNLRILANILSANSYRVALAKRGQEALDFVYNKEPDLILLDIMMPDINGIEVCKRLKESEKIEKIPVIFISVLKETEKKLKGFAVGGVDYITKPFQKEEVLARVETQLELHHAQKKLEVRNEEQNILLENIETQIWYLKDEETYGKVNISHAQFLGFKEEEIEGKSVFELLDEEEAKTCAAGNRKVFVQKEQIKKVERVKNAEGKERLLKIIKTPKLDENGEVEYIVCSADDITKKERLIADLKKSEKKFRNYVNYAPDGIFIVDSKGNYLDVNREAANMVGYTKNELLTMNIRELVFEDDLEEAVERFRRLLETGHFKDEMRLKRRDGSCIYVILEGRKLAEDRFLGFAKDITEKKELENDLKRRIELENLIIDLSRHFINSDKMLEEQIEVGLKYLGRFFEVDYSYIYLAEEKQREISEHYKWAADKVDI
ncbi:MAG: PAS domain S-box protein, partial [Halanaerobacter sp.]